MSPIISSSADVAKGDAEQSAPRNMLYKICKNQFYN